MGLDATIKRPDGLPLGQLADVQQALRAVFPGIVFGRLLSGIEKIQAAAERGVAFPDGIRRNIESLPARHGGDYEGPGFSATFILGSSDVVQQIDAVLYGTATASEPMFQLLKNRHEWVTTHP
jgi:hypothetical protein